MPKPPTPTDLATQLRRAKRELLVVRHQLKEAKALNERLRQILGYSELEGWKPNGRLEHQYGWVYAWLYPLRSYMSHNRPLQAQKITDIVTAIISQLAVSGKYGIQLPHDARPFDGPHSRDHQERMFRHSYGPCAICGETRITEECHIIPESEGGPFHRDNVLTLCPLHHHLFDHARLSPAEWKALSPALAGKMDSALAYVRRVRLPALEEFWQRSDEAT